MTLAALVIFCTMYGQEQNKLQAKYTIQWCKDCETTVQILFDIISIKDSIIVEKNLEVRKHQERVDMYIDSLREERNEKHKLKGSVDESDKLLSTHVKKAKKLQNEKWYGGSVLIAIIIVETFIIIRD